MRDRLRGYYPPSPTERADLWESGLLVLDANTLLNLHRYSQQNRTEFLAVLRGLSERLWIPYQVALEFQRNRLDVIDDQEKAYDAVTAAIEKAQTAVETEIKKHKNHPLLEADKLISDYEKATEPILASIATSRENHLTLAAKQAHADPVWDAVTEIFHGRVGASFTPEELEIIFEEGRSRYEAKIPPGFMDSRKDEPDRFGDLVIWKEILRKAAEIGNGVIFVTDDKKDDWWRIVRGQTIGPRTELIDEFFEATEKRVHFYDAQQFLRFAKEHVSAAVSESLLGEVEKVSKGRANELSMAVLLARRGELMHRRRANIQLLDRSGRGVADDPELSRLRSDHDLRARNRDEYVYRVHELDNLEYELMVQASSVKDIDRERFQPSLNQMKRERSKLNSQIAEARADVTMLAAQILSRRANLTSDLGYTDINREEIAEHLVEIDMQLEEINEAFSDLELRGE